MNNHVQISVRDGIQTITLNRPDKKNALTAAMYQALADALADASRNAEVKVSIIAGNGDSFCAGNDLEDFLGNPPQDDASPVFQFLQNLMSNSKPMVAAVQGNAVGVGTTMLLHCDLVYASDNARFLLPFVSLGICPEAASSFLIPLLVGQRKASELLLLGEWFDAAAAVDAGIVNSVHPAGDWQRIAHDRATRLSRQPPGAVQITKSLMRSSMQALARAAFQRECAQFLELVRGSEAREAFAAFVEKRRPEFR